MRVGSCVRDFGPKGRDPNSSIVGGSTPLASVVCSLTEPKPDPGASRGHALTRSSNPYNYEPTHGLMPRASHSAVGYGKKLNTLSPGRAALVASSARSRPNRRWSIQRCAPSNISE